MITTAPEVGLWRDDSHRYYWNGIRVGPGVTSVIGKVDKSGPLIGWAKGVTADAALDNLDELTVLAATKGRSVAKAWLTSHATAESDAAKNLGTRIHQAAEQIARGADPDLPPEFLPYVLAYRRFMEDWAPDYKSLERFVANLDCGYGGTFDFIARINGKLTLCDLKTGRGVYPETRLQLAALGRAEFIGMPNDAKQYLMPSIEAYAILHVRPEAYSRGYQLIGVNVNEADWQAFRGALDIYRWAEQRPSNGEPMSRGA